MKSSKTPINWASAPRLHIGIIMDGNGRWASARGKIRTAGHEAGARALAALIEHCAARPDVGELSVFAFSTENWSRPAAEIAALFGLLERFCARSAAAFARAGVAFCAFGDLAALSEKQRERLRELERSSADALGVCEPSLRLNIGINYGAADECARAAQKLMQQRFEAILGEFAAVSGGGAVGDGGVVDGGAVGDGGGAVGGGGGVVDGGDGGAKSSGRLRNPGASGGVISAPDSSASSASAGTVDVDASTASTASTVASTVANNAARASTPQALSEFFAAKLAQNPITEAEFFAALDVPRALDLLIRTGARARTSNFMQLQAAYAQLVFASEFFPDYSPALLDRDIASFLATPRTFGGL